jgi:NADP-dependent 3-hydroxy acid dehydrogenase YdfG
MERLSETFHRGLVFYVVNRNRERTVKKMAQRNPSPAFQGKAAIVTGASSGIGRAAALALAEQGACLALAARNLAALEQLAGQIQAMGGEALVAPTDVTRQEQVEALVQVVLSRWGQVDILVSNAGEYIRRQIVSMDIKDLERSLAVNFYGGVYAALAVLPHMLQRRSGHLVFVTSNDAKKGLPPDAPYVAAKFAMSGFAEVLRQELHGSGVFVSTIFPGRVETPMIADLKVPRLSAKIPPEDVARAILRAIQYRQAEVVLPGSVKLLNLVNFFSPTLADWAVRVLHLGGWEQPS